MLGQSFGDFELLIQDDSLGDEVESICREFEKGDSRVRYRRNQQNLGMPGNLNAAIARANAPLIANLHDGDVFRRDLLEKWVEAIEAEKAAFVFNTYETIDADGQHLRYFHAPFGRRLEQRELVQYMLERFDSPVWGTVMARRSAYDAVGLFNPRYSWIADVEMWMRLNLHYAVAYVPEPLMSLTPHESDRPYARVNWYLERAAVDMRAEIAAQFYGNDGQELRAYKRRLESMKTRRWAWTAGHCIRRGHWDALEDGLQMFRADSGGLLRGMAMLGSPLIRLIGRQGVFRRNTRTKDQ